MPSKWFSVKTLYRAVAEGQPERPDLKYDPDATMVEERILFIKAKNRAEAVDKAERDAKDYARKTAYVNPYNQHVRTYYTGYYDVVEMNGNPADKMEIFSATRLMSKRISDAKVARIYINKRDVHSAQGASRKFANRDYHPE